MAATTPVFIGSGTTTTENSTLAFTTSAAVPADATIFYGIFVVHTTGTGVISGVVDTDGNTYTQEATGTGVDETFSIRYTCTLFRADAPAGLTSGDTITATTSTNCYWKLGAACYSTGIGTKEDSDGNCSALGNPAQAWLTPAVDLATEDGFVIAVAGADGLGTGESSTTDAPFAEIADVPLASENACLTIAWDIAAAGNMAATGDWGADPGLTDATAIAAYGLSGAAAATTKKLATLGVG